MHFVSLSLSPLRSPGGDHEDEGGEENAILIVISTENKKGHLLSFPLSLLSLRALTAIAITIAPGF